MRERPPARRDRRALPGAGAQPRQQQRAGVGRAHGRAARGGARLDARRARRAHHRQRAPRLRARRRTAEVSACRARTPGHGRPQSPPAAARHEALRPEPPGRRQRPARDRRPGRRRPRRRRPRGRGRRRRCSRGRLLERARLVHAFEIDRRWLPRLEELAAADPRLVLHVGDALKADLGALEPPPTAVVANLAYNIAIPLIMTTIAGLPTVRRWSVMVQRELGERLFATPSTKAYSAVSVLTQLACRVEKSRPVRGVRLPAAAARGVELPHVRAARRRWRGRSTLPAGPRSSRRPGAGGVRGGLAPRASGLRAAPQDALQLARRRGARRRHPEPGRRAPRPARARARRGGAAGGAHAAAVADVRRRARPAGGRRVTGGERRMP